MKTKILLLSIFSVALLQACGGDSGVIPVDVTITPGGSTPNVNSGSVSASFVPGNKPQYQATFRSGMAFGKLDPVVQASSGAMTTLGGTVLSGNSVTKDISGDATYAMGRWVSGTVTPRIDGSELLIGNDNHSYHYIVVNAPDAFPASRTLTCGSAVFNPPTDVDLFSKVPLGTAVGSAALSFDGGVATISGAIKVSAADASGDVSLNSTAMTTTSLAISGAYLSNGAGSATMIGDAGGGAYLVATAYAATLSNGARYLGVAKFRCS